MGTYTSEASLAWLSFMSGTVSASPFILCFIYHSLYFVEPLISVENIIFSWGAVGLHGLLLLFCIFGLPAWLSRQVDVPCTISAFLITAGSMASTLGVDLPWVYVSIFVGSCLCLLLCVVAANDVVYLCPTIAHRYYELGFLAAFSVYYFLVLKNLFLAPVFLLPLVAFIVGGVCSLRALRSHPLYEAGLQRRHAIFSLTSRRYITYSIKQALEVCGWDFYLVTVLIGGAAAGTLSVGLTTPLLLGLVHYFFVFHVGLFCCLGLVFRSNVLALVYVLAAAVLLTLTHVLGPGTHNLFTRVCVFTVFLLTMFGAIGCELQIIRKKLQRAANSPRIVLGVCACGNLLMAVVFFSLNKVELGAL
ncbi:ORF 58 [Macacine gammaherpesvirus 5]|uniref:ORF58 n=1 Tax=Rhesus monkey rhadinovirus H26-95 TaxID=69256 RepID=Q9J2J3_9GAMA|nr:ORF58 [Rhesus monkey rhadinovirus H26-95]QFN51676.1 ORF 58 [Macacine gammaherpesvirus 5]QFN51768.1 ORF 58 [Macacine gammaherpesvirus 5]QFN51860.1 ORF 58 [Macacine gammaherpesvirus 5]